MENRTFKKDDIVIGTNPIDDIPVKIVSFVGVYNDEDWYEIDYRLKYSDRNSILPEHRLKLYQLTLQL